MAVDEVLLESAAAGGPCTWRLYRWQEPTLSLGYFQAYADREGHRASLGCPAVRRMSGGGAIVHDQEITYSLTIPPGHPWAGRGQGMYEAVHSTLVEWLLEGGIRAFLWDHPPLSEHGRQPFLCFQRRAPGDVVVGDAKVAGSAQRRSRGAVLQHGSIVLGRSAAAPEVGGLAGAMPSAWEPDRLDRLDRLLAGWLDGLSRRLNITWGARGLFAAEGAAAGRLAEAKYASDAWTLARGRGILGENL